MTHDEMEGSIECILQQQAKSEAKFEEWSAKFQRSLDAFLQQQAKTSSEVAQLASLGAKLAKGQVRVQNSLAGLAESHKQLAESHRRLAEAQSKTEEELKGFYRDDEPPLREQRPGPEIGVACLRSLRLQAFGKRPQVRLGNERSSECKARRSVAGRRLFFGGFGGSH